VHRPRIAAALTFLLAPVSFIT